MNDKIAANKTKQETTRVSEFTTIKIIFFVSAKHPKSNMLVINAGVKFIKRNKYEGSKADMKWEQVNMKNLIRCVKIKYLHH